MLLEVFPFLEARLPEINNIFSMFHPLFAKIMLNKATVSEMSRRSWMKDAALICDQEGLISKYGDQIDV